MINYVYGTEAFEKRAEKYKVVTSDIVQNVDVCVVGSGAAGAILANKLARAGKSVAVLEKGGYYDGESMNQRDQDMLPRLWKNSGANFTSNLRIVIAQGSCLGGSTVINDAVCFRIPDLVIEQWQKSGVSIKKEEWDRANDEVSERIHVTEVTEDEMNANASKLREACEKFLLDGKPILHYKNHRNCGQSLTDPELHSCVKCGFCHLGCHYNTKQSMLVTYIHDALTDPGIEYTVYCNCQCNAITHDGNGLATGIDGSFIDSDGNELYKIRINAKTVIVSAGSIASSNLLQKSNIGGTKVGKGLALHPAPFVLGLFEEKIYGNRGIPMSYACHEFGVTNGVEKGGFVIESIFLPIFQLAPAIPNFGVNQSQILQNYTQYTMAGVMVRDEPTGTIEMSFNGKPKVVYNLAPKTIDDIALGVSILAQMWFSVGAKSIITSHIDMQELTSRFDIPRLKDAIRNNPHGLMLGSAHPQGGNKMGNNENECVVDSDCKVFGFENLFVCDASVFPTALGVNPQLTVMALATITANKIIDNWQKLIATAVPPQSIGRTCSISQPRFCKAETIGELFAVTDHKSSLFPMLANSNESKLVVGKNWNFDSKTLKIFNNLFWKGFYGRDNDILTAALRYFGGFYKRFLPRDARTMDGVTHPFETKLIDARSVATEKELPGYGKVIHLEYQDAPYSTAYDLLKITDENTIIGKAFLGPFGKGRELFNFSMSRVYDIEFLTKEDLLTLFNSKDLSREPTGKELAGTWEGMLVSDSSISPRSQLFYFNYEGGEVDMRYSFANLLRGRSDVKMSDTLFRLDDQTAFHDEIRMVTPNLAVGVWMSEWSSVDLLMPILNNLNKYLAIPTSSELHSFFEKFSSTRHIANLIRQQKEPGLGFVEIEEDDQRGARIGLSYILKKIQ